MKKALLLIICFSLSACVYTQHNKDRREGTLLSPQQLAAIEIGKTNRQWVLTNLGVPERTQSEKDGLEVFEYVSGHTKTSEKKFIFLFDINSEKDVYKRVTRLVMRNGIVETVVDRDER
ncbi:MAG TPA: hypothetical protein VN030_03765 [Cellvibrio sp.]|nr:hypothetical protein [Cellvibrio sp.]